VPVGETCTAVGYGRYTDEDGNIATGTRRSRETVIREINPEYPKTFNAGPEINPGDSGGPILCGPDKAIIGIAVSDGGQYATIDVDWIESTIKNGVPPAEPEVIDELTPEQQLLSTSGELCPDGTMELVGGGVSSRSSVPPIDQDGDGNLTCKMQLSVLIPAGKKLAMPVLCVNAHSDTPPPSAASIMYTFAEQSFPIYEWNVPGVTGPQEHCDTLAYTSATCEDPAQSHTLIFTADISVPVTEETGVSTIQVTPKLWAPDTAWTNCQ
jgi:hypothetical protein